MKKKVIPVLVFLSFVGGAYAQTGIGIPIPNKTSELEIFSENKGVLIPRLKLKSDTDTTTVFGDKYPESLVVYHLGNDKMIAGFYYWSDNRWNALVSNNTLYKYFNEKVVGNVIYKNDDFYYTVKDDSGNFVERVVSLEQIIKANSVVAKLDVKTAGNASDVKAGFTFNDGKSGSIDKVFAETLTPIDRTAPAGSPIITTPNADLTYYTYKDETGVAKNITISQDVSNDFKTIVNQGDNKAYIENIVNNAAPSASIANTIANTVDKKGTGFTFNNGKALAGSYLESVTGFTTAKTDVDLSDGTKGKSIVYNYKDESINTHALNITDDVATSFKTIINQGDNKTYIENIAKEVAGPGAVAKLDVKTAGNASDVKAGFTFNDGKSGSIDKAFAETLTPIDRKAPAGSPVITTPNADLTYYTYKDETGVVKNITISQDVSNDFKTIVNQGDNKAYIENIVSTTAPSASIANTAANTATNTGLGFTFNNGKAPAGSYLESVTGFTTAKTDVDLSDGTKGKSIVYNYKDEAIKTHALNITDDVATSFKTIINQGDNKAYIENIVNNAAPSASIANTIANTVDKKGTGFTFNNGKAPAGSYLESVTGFTTAKTDVDLSDGTKGKSIVYNYKDESINTHALNITDDVATSFKTIINQGDNKTYIENIAKEVAGPGAVAKLDVKTAGNASDVKAGFTFNDGKSGSIDKAFAETLTPIDRKAPAGSPVITTPNADLTYYTYKDETGVAKNITISQDVSNDFKTIVNQGDNKAYIENIVSTTAPSASIANTAANTATNTGLGFTFNNGKAPAGSYLESVTGFTTAKTDVDLSDGTKGKSIVYNYKDESINTHALNITDDVATSFKTIINQGDNKAYIENIVNNAAPSASIANTAANTATNIGAGFTFNNGKAPAGSYLESVTGFTTAVTDVDLSDGTKGKSIVYNYKDESIKTHALNITDDVATSFKTIINQGDNKTYIENISKGSNLYSTTKETISGKFDDKDIMRYVVDLTQNTSFTAVELPKAINGMILDATLINKGTNAIVRGVIFKQVSGTKTTLSIGIVGTIITSNPAGNYCVIVEYVKQ